MGEEKVVSPFSSRNITHRSPFGAGKSEREKLPGEGGGSAVLIEEKD